MSVPQPPFSLDGHCSAVYNDTLYVLTASGFASLRLDKHQTTAAWKKENGGQPVKDASCVKVVPDGVESQAALFVIGGQTNNQTYGGLQKYTFASNTWEVLPVVVNVLSGRTNHSVAYLKDSSSILVYAGSQPSAPSALSSQTFLISTIPPYNVRAFTSTAPPANLPILHAFNDSHAIMVGGTQLSNGIFIWSPQSAWQRLPTNITRPLSRSARATVINGKGRTKVLQVYNFDTSPSTVTSLVIQDAEGRPAATGQTVSTNTTQSRMERSLNLQDWPNYNDTNAPRVAREDSSIAEASNGLVVITGGSTDVPIALFDRSNNTWIDPTTFFERDDQQVLAPSTTATTRSSATSATTTTPSALASQTNNNDGAAGRTSHDQTLRTLGITLGVLCGLAAIFILLLLWLRWRKSKKRSGNASDREKSTNRMSFADRGASFMKEAEGSIHDLSMARRNRYDSMAGSRSSLAIMTGRFGKRNPVNHAPKQSYESTARLVKDKDVASIQQEGLEMADLEKRLPGLRATEQVRDSANEREIKQSRKRSSGWSKYFAASQSTTNLSHIPSVYIKPERGSDISRYSGEAGSAKPFQPVMTKPLASLKYGSSETGSGQRSFGDYSGPSSVAMSHSETDTNVGIIGLSQKGRLGDGEPRKSTVSAATLSLYDGGDRFSLNSTATDDFFAEHGDLLWNPVGSNKPNASVHDRPSSNYSISIYEANSANRIPSRGRSAGFFPGAGTTYRPSSRPRSSANQPPEMPAPAVAVKPGISSGGITNGLPVPRPPEARESTLTIFPGVSTFESPTKPMTNPRLTKPASAHDISWVDLADK